MTAAGLFVAIPAVLAYNAFTRANRLVLAQLDGFAHSLHPYLVAGVRLDRPGGATVTPLRAMARQPAHVMAFHYDDSPVSSGQPMAEINMIPLVDIMLVLLVIFIITAPLFH